VIGGSAFHKSATSDSFSAGVYGSIVATAIVGALHEEHAAPGKIVLSLVTSMAVFFLAHTWSEITGERIYHAQQFDWKHVGEIAASEWPLLEAAAGPAIPLLLGAGGVISNGLAADLALAVCVVQCAAWGLLVGIRAYHMLWKTVISAAVTTALALGLVALEVLVLH
jgi:hypothetical protein